MKLPRMTVWLVVSIGLAALVYLTYPAAGAEPLVTPWTRFLTVVHKLNLVTFAGWLCYWLDRAAFPYSRPHVHAQAAAESDDNCDPTRAWLAVALLIGATLRRALIMAAGMIAVALGL